MHQFAGAKLEADTLQHMTITAPNVDLLDLETVSGSIHRGASVAKSNS
jgi:hypothetical protein